jgi:hypothetical protein
MKFLAVLYSPVDLIAPQSVPNRLPEESNIIHEQEEGHNGMYGWLYDSLQLMVKKLIWIYAG